MLLLVTICFLLFLKDGCEANEIEVGGSISHNLIYLLKENRLLENATYFKIFLEKYFFNHKGKFHLSFKGDYDSVQNKELIKLNEAYGDVYLKNIDLRMGRQIIRWGTADGINPTSFVTPPEFSFEESEPIVEPIACFRGTYYNRGTDVTAVIVFNNQFRAIPVEIEEELQKSVHGEGNLLLLLEPAKTLNNMEYAFKIDTRLVNNDVRLSYFHGWEDYPALWINNEFEVKSQYRRVNKVGLATAGIAGKGALWSEVAYVIPEKIEEMNSANTLFTMNKPYFQLILGIDYTFKEMYLEGQYIYYGNGSLISPYFRFQRGEKVPAAHYFMVSSHNFNKIRNLRLDSIVNLGDQSYILIPQYGFYISEGVYLSLRGVLFFGNEKAEFGRLKDKELVNLGVKISF
ncbi:hypothetical protein J7K28_01550 [Candidatus Aerophobetes bacterium]|nr:hypothetical protein [Candidatus Aerophobetes bacterium]